MELEYATNTMMAFIALFNVIPDLGLLMQRFHFILAELKAIGIGVIQLFPLNSHLVQVRNDYFYTSKKEERRICILCLGKVRIR